MRVCVGTVDWHCERVYGNMEIVFLFVSTAPFWRTRWCDDFRKKPSEDVSVWQFSVVCKCRRKKCHSSPSITSNTTNTLRPWISVNFRSRSVCMCVYILYIVYNIYIFAPTDSLQGVLFSFWIPIYIYARLRDSIEEFRKLLYNILYKYECT